MGSLLKPAKLVDTLTVYRLLAPLEDEGWMVFAGGSTLRYGEGEDIDLLLGRDPSTDTASNLQERLPLFGLANVRPHVNSLGETSGFGLVAEWNGLKVDIGVLT